jgi:hypothetical protein
MRVQPIRMLDSEGFIMGTSVTWFHFFPGGFWTGGSFCNTNKICGFGGACDKAMPTDQLRDYNDKTVGLKVPCLQRQKTQEVTISQGHTSICFLAYNIQRLTL